MDWETYTAFVMFVVVMTGTPGAGNLTMMGIGQTAGFRASLPFLAGTVVGAVTLDTMVGFGLGGIFLASPELAWIMKIVGMLYICYLGWKLLTAQLSDSVEKKRFTFLEGCVLHPLNPKSWAMAVVGFSQIADPSRPLPGQVAIYVLTFMFFQVTFHSAWGMAGAVIMRTLRSKAVLTCVNAMLVAVMIGATAYAMFV